MRSAVLFVGVLLACPLGSARALEDFVNRVPNPLTANEKGCITCHNNPNGGQGCGEGTAYPMVPKCFNPFGEAFSANNRVWDNVLANLDSDGDGFSNGQELQDPKGTWRFLIDPPTRGTVSCVSAPGFKDAAALPTGISLSTDPGKDGDGDGFCCVGHDENHNGDCRAQNEHTGQVAAVGDCNDAALKVYPGAGEICLGNVDQDCDGAAGITDSECAHLVDNDGDGFCEVGKLADNADRFCTGPSEMTPPVDCNDSAATVFPGARESCFDDLDNDCNSKVDLDDQSCSGAQAYADSDRDGFCLLGHDLSQPLDGDCGDPGEDSGPFDCDDTRKSVNPSAVEDCQDRSDNDCDGDADLEDDTCRPLVDGDGDGFCTGGRDLSVPADGDCADVGEGGGPALDCDDDSANSYPGALEICIDDRDNDCDGANSLLDSDCIRFIDQDGDGFCGEGWDLDGDGDCSSSLEPAGPGDCNDGTSAVNPEQHEVCTDSIDNDCDGRTDGSDRNDCGTSVDLDGDGYCEVGRDLNDDGDCGDEAETLGASDCDPRDATRYPTAPEVCFDGLDNDCNGIIDLDDPQCVRGSVGDIDADGDGSCPVGVDQNHDGDCTDQGEGVKALSDCNDRNAAVHVGADEVCDDSVDNDCDFLVDLADRARGSSVSDPTSCARVLDQDRDSFCPVGRDRNGDGDCIDVSEPAPASDCDDDNARAFPGFAEVCGDGADNDCDGHGDFTDSECPCESNAQCDDGDACTSDRCADKRCLHEAVACEDGDGGMAMGAGDGGSGTSSEDGGAMHGDSSNSDLPLKLNDGCSLTVHSNESRVRLWWLVLAALVPWRLRRRLERCT